MSYTFRTKEGEGISLTMNVRFDPSSYTITAEFRGHPLESNNVNPLLLTVPVSKQGKKISLNLTAQQVDTLKGAYFNIKAVGTNASAYIEDGRLSYSPKKIVESPTTSGSVTKQELDAIVENIDVPTTSEIQTIAKSKIAADVEDILPARLTQTSLNNSFPQFWKPNETVTSGAIRISPDGSIIQRNANGSTRSSYDATEIALWTVRGGVSQSEVSELVRDTMGTALIPGSSNVSIVASDVNDTILISVASEESFRTMSDRQRIPTLTKLSPVVASRSQVGLNTIYVPWMIRVPDSVYQAYPTLGRFRIYTSTDHDVGDGGIAMVSTQATDPTAAGTVWTPYRTSGGSAIMFMDGVSRQTETPCVVYEPADPAGKPFRMYYQVAVGTTQTTRVARSADGVTNWEIVGDAIPNLPQTVAGWNHTGYARVWFIDGLWCAFHLMGSGVGTSNYGWSYSYDGLSFVTERAAVTADLQDTDGVLRLGLSGLFEFRGQLWAVGRQTEYTSGAQTSTVALIYAAPINDDLRSFKGRPQLLSWPLIANELSDNPPGIPTTWVTLNDGRLVGAYRVSAANNSNDYIRLAVLS
jgi:hypothetical protein